VRSKGNNEKIINHQNFEIMLNVNLLSSNFTNVLRQNDDDNFYSFSHAGRTMLVQDQGVRLALYLIGNTTPVGEFESTQDLVDFVKA
jgi:hypothetical protein